MPPPLPVRSLARLGALLALLLLAFTVLLAIQAWQSETNDQIRQMQTVLELIEKSTDRYLPQVESGLAGLARDLAAADSLRDPARAQRLLRQFNALHPDSTGISLVRLDGQIVASSAHAGLADLPSLAGDPSFQTFVASVTPATRMDLGRPRNGPISGRWIFPLRFVMRDDRGVPQAYVVSAMPVELLQGFWREAPAAERLTIGLQRDDGYLLSRLPVPADMDAASLYGRVHIGALQQHLIGHAFPRRGYVEGRNAVA